MTRVAIYTRVSTAKQEDNTSLQTQLVGCRAKAKKEGWHVVAEFQEVVSGAALYRKEWGRLIELIRSGGVDVVLAHDLDRLTRDQNQDGYLAHELDKVGGRIKLVHGDFDNSPYGKAIRSMLAFTKEIERQSLIERSNRGRRSRAQDRGQWLPGNKAAYGLRYADPGKTKLESDPETVGYVLEMFDAVSNGGSANGIAKDFNSRGIPTPTGRTAKWGRTSVAAILRNPIYTGRAIACRGTWETVVGKKKDGTTGQIKRYRRADEAEQIELPEGTAPRLVSLETFNRVQAQLANNKSVAIRRNGSPESYLLRAGYIVCGYCGNAMRTHWHSSKYRTKPYPVYRCSNRDRHGCPTFVIGAPVIDGAVWEKVSDVLSDPAYFRQFIDKRVSVEAVQADIATITAHISDLKSRAARLVRLAETLDDDDTAELAARMKQLASQRQRAESDLALKESELSDLSGRKAQFDRLLATVAEASMYVEGLDYQSKRGWLEALGVKTTVWAKDHEPRWQIDMAIDPASWDTAGELDKAYAEIESREIIAAIPATTGKAPTLTMSGTPCGRTTTPLSTASATRSTARSTSQRARRDILPSGLVVAARR